MEGQPPESPNGHVLAFCLPHYPWRHGISAAGSCHAGGSGYAYSTETRRGARCPKGSPDCCVVGKRYPRFMWLTAGIGHAPAIPTLHMCFRRNMELVVELYSGSGWLCLDDGGGGARCRRCNGRIRVVVAAAAVNGRSVVVRVVDECDYVNGCCNEDGFAPPCQDNVGGESLTVWKKLGSTRTGANRHIILHISQKFLNKMNGQTCAKKSTVSNILKRREYIH
ncbi:hypothetical protein OsI_14625 [Oryza sativa Indica Group]|uniref:Uncharacterized protein n=1 Tax=Oryza sativa subsp. indica TaxID=39946 RepID=A2XPR2_ORYSI|nr:hypothetical protein OsI_14625 [Oryza sativa Indica Group]